MRYSFFFFFLNTRARTQGCSPLENFDRPYFLLVVDVVVVVVVLVVVVVVKYLPPNQAYSLQRTFLPPNQEMIQVKTHAHVCNYGCV